MKPLRSAAEIHDQTFVIMREVKALLSGHFVFSAGNHGDQYVNKDLLYPHLVHLDYVTHLMYELIQPLKLNFSVIVTPAIGGVALGTMLAHQFELNAHKTYFVYAEKDGEKFIIKRGYENFVRQARVLVVEDIVNSAASVNKVIQATRDHGGEVVAVAALCNRGTTTADQLGVPHFVSSMKLEANSWPASECPLCRDGVPVNTSVGHGRRFLEEQQGVTRRST